MVEQLCLNGFTLYEYICSKKMSFFLTAIVMNVFIYVLF